MLQDVVGRAPGTRLAGDRYCRAAELEHRLLGASPERLVEGALYDAANSHRAELHKVEPAEMLRFQDIHLALIADVDVGLVLHGAVHDTVKMLRPSHR